MADTKKCSKCRETKGRDSFYKDRSKKSGLSSKCRGCESKRDRAEYNKRKVKEPRFNHKKKLKWKYGITLEDYDQILEQQNGVCAICHTRETVKNRYGSTTRLSVDHNHETGKVRGLLCFRCNSGIGCFDDSPTILAEAIRYLLHS